MPIKYHEAAEEELLHEIGYLELRANGLGRRFFAEVRRAEDLMAQLPESAAEIMPGIRRRILRKFPYSLTRLRGMTCSYSPWHIIAAGLVIGSAVSAQPRERGRAAPDKALSGVCTSPGWLRLAAVVAQATHPVTPSAARRNHSQVLRPAAGA